MSSPLSFLNIHIFSTSFPSSASQDVSFPVFGQTKQRKISTQFLGLSSLPQNGDKITKRTGLFSENWTELKNKSWRIYSISVPSLSEWLSSLWAMFVQEMALVRFLGLWVTMCFLWTHLSPLMAFEGEERNLSRPTSCIGFFLQFFSFFRHNLLACTFLSSMQKHHFWPAISVISLPLECGYYFAGISLSRKLGLSKVLIVLLLLVEI